MEPVNVDINKVSVEIAQMQPDKLSINDKLISRLSKLIPKDVLSNKSLTRLIIINTDALHYVPYAAINIADNNA